MLKKILLGSLAASAAFFAPAALSDEVLRNNDIALMVEVGLSEMIIQQKIATSENFFDMSAAAMIELKARDVPESLIQAMHQETLKNRKKFQTRINGEIRKLASGTAEQKRSAFLYLKKIDAPASPVLRDALTFPQPEIRAAAAMMLAELGDHECVALLRELLTDPEIATRAAAADALAKFRDTEAIERAHAALRKDETVPLSGFVRLLGAVHDIAGADLVGRRLLKDTDPQTRAEAARALGEINAGAAVRTLTDALRNDPDSQVRAAAITSLGQIGSEESLPVLQDICRTVPDLRAAALAAIGHYPAKESVPFLIAALAQPLKGLERATVVKSLRELTDREYGDSYADWEQFLLLFQAEHQTNDFSALAPQISAAIAPAAVQEVAKVAEIEEIPLP